MSWCSSSGVLPNASFSYDSVRMLDMRENSHDLIKMVVGMHENCTSNKCLEWRGIYDGALLFVTSYVEEWSGIYNGSLSTLSLLSCHDVMLAYN